MPRAISQILAEFIYDNSYEDFPANVIIQAKYCLIDTVGAIIAGSFHSHSGKIVKGYISELDEKGRASIVGSKLMRSSETAAFANGVMAHALELDDGSRHATYHPGSSIVPSILALCEERGYGGKTIIESIIMGYEISLRIGKSVNPQHYLKGFHPTGTVAHFGTTAASCKIMALKKDVIVNALGLAGSLASGINQYEKDGSLVKHLHPGNAARNGIFAAKLAQKGLTGPEDVIEGSLGFCHCFSDNYDTSLITKDLGANYDILSIYFKPYCSCRYVHYAIEATENIIKEHKLSASKIGHINVLTHQNAKQGSDIPDYQSVLHARLSIQYGIASILVRGKAGLAEYTEEAIKDPIVKDISKKISIKVDPEIQKLYPNPRSMIVHIIDSSGNEYSSCIDHAKGDPENPMSEDELVNKFISITSGLASKDEQRYLINNALHIDEIDNISSFMTKLREL